MAEILALTETELQSIIQRTAVAVTRELRQDMQREVMTRAELADYLRCDVSKINRYMARKVDPLPFIQFGGRPRFRRSAVDKWLDDSKALQREEAQAS
jgi:excisionase family DNA binding protein